MKKKSSNEINYFKRTLKRNPSPNTIKKGGKINENNLEDLKRNLIEKINNFHGIIQGLIFHNEVSEIYILL